MKRSLHVTAPLLASTALALLTTGCRRPEPKRCVDENNRVVDPSFCGAQPNARPGGYYGGGFYPYHFLYGGSGGSVPGAIISGGSATPLAGHSYSSSTSRGGFGSSFGGGGSEGSGGGHSGGGGGE